jgi:DNA-binding NarL/FixJ family response regulator
VTGGVVVVDDQPLVRAGLRGIIDAAPDLTVVAEAADGAAALDAVAAHRPDVVLMDIRMPGMNGIDATAAITASGGARVLMLTTFDLDDYVYAALRAGASGFLLKDAPPADLHAAIRVIADGEALLAPAITRRLIERHVTRTAPAPAAGVTDREREVLLLIAEGLTNTEIGRRLHITAGTVKTHVAHLLTKLDARDRIQLVIYAYRAGLVS